MTRRKKRTKSLSDEKLKVRKRARKPESVGRKPTRQSSRRTPIDHSAFASPDSIRHLQQTAGNRVVARLVAEGAAAGPPAVQRDAITPAAEEQDLVGGPTTKATMPGAPPAVPMPYPNTSPGSQSSGDASKAIISSNAPAVTSNSKMGSSMGDEPGTMNGIRSAANVSNMPGQSSVAIEPSTGMVPIQGPGPEEGTQPTPAPEPEEQEAS